MDSPLPTHTRAFRYATAWTLGLLFLGSVVHATESSLACPDWPTCYGTMVPVMEGGIFWEHLHRLVAGGLVLIWTVGTWYAFREGAAPRIRNWALVGVGLLLVQSVFGGLTVLMQLPDAVSTTHLGLAFAFLVLASALSVASSPTQADPGPRLSHHGRLASAAAGMVFVQSLIGAAVRHTDSGLACPDIPLCLGEWVPPLEQWPIALHFTHRAFGVATLMVVLWVVARGINRRRSAFAHLATGALVLLQVLLGFASVGTFLAVWAVSLHTLVAAAVLCLLAVIAARELVSRPKPGGPIRPSEGTLAVAA